MGGGGLGQQISSLQSLQLDLPPSCVEFSPVHPSFFLVGTYYLQKEDATGEPSPDPNRRQNRSGSIVVFQVVDESLIHIQTETQPSAILDLHFQPHTGKQDICGAVSSTATLGIFSFSPETQPSSPLTPLGAVRIPALGEEVLFLSFCWLPSAQDAVAITTSTGHVHLLRLGAGYDSCAVTTAPVITHSLETWCVAVSPPSLSPQSLRAGPAADKEEPCTLLSGGDDSRLQYATVVVGPQRPNWDATDLVADCPFPAAKISGHDAGVTAILPLSLKIGPSDLVVTGSYDDHIRLFSIEPLHNANGVRKVQRLAEADLGGGVWRLKQIEAHDRDGPSGKGWAVLILASCMHAGARIVELGGMANGDYEFRVLGSFEEHQSMNYGSDVQPGSEGSLTCVSTSFYDKLLCLWKFETPSR